MTLGSDEMIEMMYARLGGKQVVLDTPEKKEFMRKFEQTVRLADEKGWIIEIPSEIPSGYQDEEFK